jgi:hypothetical protein
LKTDNYSTLIQTKMFINVTDKRVRSKGFRVFSRKVFVQMRDTANGYDAIENAILLAIPELMRGLGTSVKKCPN